MRNVIRYSAACAAVLLCAASEAARVARPPGHGYGVPQRASRTLYGERQAVAGGHAFTWATLNPWGEVLEAGVSLPARSILAPGHGNGPLGAFVSVDFPAEAKAAAFLDHFEAHWNPMGHEPEVYETPHFDFHFYAIPESRVMGIFPPDNRVPDANRIPAGYIYPGVDAAVPMMGVHAVDPMDFTHAFHTSMVLGYWHGDLIFVEPMITYDFMRSRAAFQMNIPAPAVLDRTNAYPRTFRSRYNPRANTYELTLSNFVTVPGAGHPS